MSILSRTYSHPKEQLIKFYKMMLRIRIIEERIAELYPLGKMRTPIHLSIGQEAVPTGVCAALKNTDAVFASHRCHAAYFAKGGALKHMLAELYGRVTGVCKGKGGSAHLVSPKKNMYSAPILGAMIPVAVGAALSFSMDKSKRVSAVFFGDAALEEGVCAESINFAVLKKLPILFVCENNFYSTHTHIRYRQPDEPIYKRIRSFGIDSGRIDGNNVLEVYVAALEKIDKCRRGQGPFFLECITYRYREHVGPNYDFNNPYRSKEEVENWMRRCPVRRIEETLVSGGVMTIEEISSLKRKFNSEVNRAIHYAENSLWPSKKGLTEDVY